MLRAARKEPPARPAANAGEDRGERVVEEAVRFIEARSAEEALSFSLEVGEHLLEKVFDGDLALLRSNQPSKRVAMARIARDGRVDLPESTLYACVHVFVLARRYLERHPGLPVPDIAPSVWSRMWPLVDEDDETLFAVLAWVARERVPRDTVEDVVQTVGPYVEAGGRLGDLLVGDPEEPADTPYRRMQRMLRVERKWLAGGRAGGISRAIRARALAAVAEIERRLAG